MKIEKLFTIFDSAAEVYLPPFFVPTEKIAKRAFADCINSDTHQFGKHPDDYTLFYLGEFLDTDASFNITTPKSLGNGVEYLDPDHIDSLGEFRGTNTTPIQSDESSPDPA